MRETNSSRRAVFLKPEALEAALAAELRELGVLRITGPRLAKHLDVPYGTYWRQTLSVTSTRAKGPGRRQTPSPEFQAAVLDHFGENRFGEFFEACDIELVAA